MWQLITRFDKYAINYTLRKVFKYGCKFPQSNYLVILKPLPFLLKCISIHLSSVWLLVVLENMELTIYPCDRASFQELSRVKTFQLIYMKTICTTFRWFTERTRKIFGSN